MVGIEPIDEGAVVTVFWSRLRDMSPEEEVDYRESDLRLRRAAEQIPGFAGIKSYTADDGERLSVVVFDSAEAQRHWREHPDHVVAQRKGRESFYSEYQIIIARTLRQRRWSGAVKPDPSEVVQLPDRR